jgi:hypothetical protein
MSGVIRPGLGALVGVVEVRIEQDFSGIPLRLLTSLPRAVRQIFGPLRGRLLPAQMVSL